MTSTSIKAFSALSVLILFTGLASASHYYSDDGYSVTGDSAFVLPEYDSDSNSNHDYNSQAELATELIAPFIFLVVLLKFTLERVLQFVLDTNDHPPWSDNGESVSREATVMSVAIAGMLIPTPFWGYIRLIAGGIGFLASAAVLLVVGYLIFSFLSG